MKAENMPFVIVRAQPEDTVELLEYFKLVGGETENLGFGAEGMPVSFAAECAALREQVNSADRVQYLAKAGGRIVGDASLDRRHGRMSHRGELGITVRKSYWGSGAASALMEAVIAFARKNGFEQLNLEVRSDNIRAIRLYEKYGFRKLCTFPAYFKIEEKNIDFDLMNLELEH